MSARASEALSKVGTLSMEPRVDVLYSGKEHDWSANANLRVENGARFLDLGVDDIGNDSLFNAQVGRRRGSLGARGGVVAGKVGLGLDAYAGDKFTFSADAYDPDDVKLRLRAAYDLGGGTALLGQFDDVTVSEKRAGYFGLRQTC